MSIMTKKPSKYQPETDPQVILSNLREANGRAKIALEIVKKLHAGEDLGERLTNNLNEELANIRKQVFPVRVPKSDEDFSVKISAHAQKVNLRMGRAAISLTGLYNASSQGNAHFAKQWQSCPDDVLQAALPEGYLDELGVGIAELKSEMIHRHAMLAEAHARMCETAAESCEDFFMMDLIPPQFMKDFVLATNPNIPMDHEMAASIVASHYQQIAHKEAEIAEFQLDGVYTLLLDYQRRKKESSLVHANMMLQQASQSIDFRCKQLERWLEDGRDKPIFIGFNPK